MSTPAISAHSGMAQAQHKAQDLQDKSRQIDSLKRDLHPAKDKSKKLREACEGFESVFIQKMWEQMRATVPKGGMLQGKDEQYWQGMFDQELSKKMSSAGGIGLADMMYEQLSRNLVSASRTTASGLSASAAARVGQNTEGEARSGFTVSAAPLLPPSSATVAAHSMADKGGTGIYAGEAPQPEAQKADSRAGGQQSTAMAGPAGPAGPAGQVSPVSPAGPAGQTGEKGLASQSGLAGQQGPGPEAPAPGGETSPVVLQVLEQLRAQNAQNPQAQPAPGPTGLQNAQAAAQIATTRMPAGGGVLPPMPPMPPMTPMQRQGQIHYSAAKVQGRGTNTQSRASSMAPLPAESAGPAAAAPYQGAAPAQGQNPQKDPAPQGFGTPTVPGSSPSARQSTQPLSAPNQGTVQGSPGVVPHQYVQRSFLAKPAEPANAAALAAGFVGQTAQTGQTGQTGQAGLTGIMGQAGITGQTGQGGLAGPMGQAAGPTPPTPIPMMSMTAEQIAGLAAAESQAQAAAKAAPMAQNPQAGPIPGVTPSIPGQPLAAASPPLPPTAQEPQIIHTTFSTNVPPARRNGRQGQRMAKGQAIRSLNPG